MSGKSAARAAALAALKRIEQNQAYSGLVLPSESQRFRLTGPDKAMAYRLVYGVITHKASLDWVLARFCHRDLTRLSPQLKNILRLGCYQLIYLRVPDFAAVNEAVAMAARLGGRKLTGFVNGVLRNVARNWEQVFAQLDQDSAEGIGIIHSHPRWLVEEWLDKWGPDFTRQLCRANNEPGPLTIRVNTGKISVIDYCRLLAKHSIDFRQSSYHPDGLILAKDTPFSALPGFSDGLFIVQGEAAMLPAQAMDLAPGQEVLDMCSAPGGKTTQIAAAISPGTVVACDLHRSRLDLVAGHANRLGLANIRLVQGDARNLDFADNSFARILLDAPCTGFGVVRNKPDIKWHRSRDDAQKLEKLQRQLLTEAARLLKPGGILVYATCTLREQENEGAVADILAREANLRPLPVDGRYYRYTFPHRDNLDGFFFARLTKVE